MPFYGGHSPYPRRYGGGVRGGTNNAPLLQRVQESLASQMGSAYDQSINPITSIVGAETMAYARAITFDVHGANERLANEMFPPTSTIGGLLPRWEAIMGTPPILGDTQTTRQARVAAKWLQVATGNRDQEVADALSAALGPIYVGLLHQDPTTALVYWPGGNTLTGFPWYSTIALLNVELTIPTGYANADGTPNAKWWAAVGTVAQTLDPMLPIWMTFQWFILSITQNPGHTGFYLDEPDLDLEIFDV